MSFRVYISHSIAPYELGAIYGMAELASRKGMEPIIPDRRWQSITPPPRIMQLLAGLDAFVVIATSAGQDLELVNRELSTALELGLKSQNVISVIDQSIQPPGAGVVVILDRTNLRWTEEVVKVLEKFQLQRTQQNLLAGLIVGGLIALILASKD